MAFVSQQKLTISSVQPTIFRDVETLTECHESTTPLIPQLRHGPFPALHGISQFPYAVEAIFPVGPYQIYLDRHSLKKVSEGHQMRFHIPKPNGSTVPTHTFLDPRYKQISAIWALDLNGASVIGNSEPSALVHNPNAVQPLEQGLLLADDEFIAVKTGDNEYMLTRYGRDTR
jgi:type I restriction enzyme S subunit